MPRASQRELVSGGLRLNEPRPLSYWRGPAWTFFGIALHGIESTLAKVNQLDYCAVAETQPQLGAKIVHHSLPPRAEVRQEWRSASLNLAPHNFSRQEKLF